MTTTSALLLFTHAHSRLALVAGASAGFAGCRSTTAPSQKVHTSVSATEHLMLWMLTSDAMPRTTMDLDSSVLAELRRRAADEHKSIGRLASELLAQQLAAISAPPDQDPLDWISRDLGMPRVDLDDKEALNAVLDGRS